MYKYLRLKAPLDQCLQLIMCSPMRENNPGFNCDSAQFNLLETDVWVFLTSLEEHLKRVTYTLHKLTGHTMLFLHFPKWGIKSWLSHVSDRWTTFLGAWQNKLSPKTESNFSFLLLLNFLPNMWKHYKRLVQTQICYFKVQERQKNNKFWCS